VQIQNGDGTELSGNSNSSRRRVGGAPGHLLVLTEFSETAGLQEIRMVNTIGEFNVNSINFVFENSFLPAKVTIATISKSNQS
jgi:hypothetical protein